MSIAGHTHYFSNASNTVINNLNITHFNGNAHSNGSERNGLRRLLENISEGAFHDAAERGDPPKCHPHTRVAILAEIMEWISTTEARRKFIIWMYGPAGSGKTAIGQSIAEECKRRGLLTVSFFFSRTAPGRNNTARVIATIAYQISRFLPQVENLLLVAIEQDPTIFSRALAVQMQVLVVEPLKALPPLPQPIFVVLDGLDEAGPSPQDQVNLLSVISTAITELQHIPIIFLLASRPKYEIRKAFRGHLLNSLTQPLVLDDNYKPDDDIKLYLTSIFEEIHDKHVQLRTRLPSPWPSKSDIDRLVSKASGQFIFAATVLKFIDSVRHHPAERLNVIFGLTAPGNETPFALLDALYRYILSSVVEPAKVLKILTILILEDPQDPILIEEIEELLDLEVQRVLVDMHALMFVPPPTDYTTELRIHHASLHDFLTDRSRSHDFYIDINQGHLDFTRRWGKVIANYHNSRQLHLPRCLRSFVHHCRNSPTSVGLTDALACLHLKQLLEDDFDLHNLYLLPWTDFFDCILHKASDRDNIFLRLQGEFDTFILDRLSRYPPALQTHIPTILILSSSSLDMHEIFHLLSCGLEKSTTEGDNIYRLDSTLLHLSGLPICLVDEIFSASFQDQQRAGKYYVDDSSHLALAKKIVGITFLGPGKNHQQIDMKYGWFHKILRKVPQDVDLATLLRENALQYNGHGTGLSRRRHQMACNSLEYIRRCGIPYLEHAHIQGTDRCVVCDICDGALVVVNLDQWNGADAAAFPAFPVPEPALSSIPEALLVAEPPTKWKRKRGLQNPAVGFERSTRLKTTKIASR